MRQIGACALFLLFPVAAAASSRITFERTLPPRVDLGGIHDLAVTQVVGDTDKVAIFLDVFLEQTNRSGTLRVHDRTTPSTPGPVRRRRQPLLVHRPLPADAFLKITSFTCQTDERTAEGSSYDVDRNRVRHQLRWADAICRAHIDAVTKHGGDLMAEITARGEGTSPRVEKVTDDDRAVAIDQAARFAAIAAAEEITPRKIRESIALAAEAPQFEEGMALVDAEKVVDARRTWEAALRRYPGSAALHFNVAAVCEALGDIRSAESHFSAACRLAPTDDRFSRERDLFRRRNGLRR